MFYLTMACWPVILAASAPCQLTLDASHASIIAHLEGKLYPVCQADSCAPECWLSDVYYGDSFVSSVSYWIINVAQLYYTSFRFASSTYPSLHLKPIVFQVLYCDSQPSTLDCDPPLLCQTRRCPELPALDTLPARADLVRPRLDPESTPDRSPPCILGTVSLVTFAGYLMCKFLFFIFRKFKLRCACTPREGPPPVLFRK